MKQIRVFGKYILKHKFGIIKVKHMLRWRKTFIRWLSEYDRLKCFPKCDGDLIAAHDNFRIGHN